MSTPSPLEIQSEEFAHESDIHGRSHAHRVMFWTKQISRSQGLFSLEIEALCAARLHDLARTTDGTCLIHGAMATTLLPKYTDLFQRLGVKNFEGIQYAVAVHCLPTRLDKTHPHYQLAAILRDADSLDRFRCIPDGPGAEYIEFESTFRFLAAAYRLAQNTLPNETPLDVIVRMGEELVAPLDSCSEDTRSYFPA